MLCKICLDIFVRILSRDAKLRRKTKSAHAVDNAKIDSLGSASLFQRDFVFRNAQYARCCSSVDIFSVVEGLDQSFITGHMSQHTQLDLRIVSSHQYTVFFRDECFPQFPAHLLTDRDVLQIRLCTADPARGRDRLVKMSVHLAVRAAYERDQTVHIGAFQLGNGPVF